MLGSRRLGSKANILKLSLFLVVLLISACQPDKPSQQLIQQQLFAFGTLIDISLLSNNPQQARQVINELSAEFDRLHSQWHPWKDGDLAQANRKFSSPSPFSTSPSIVSLIEQSQQLSQQSNGLFNPAIGQLIKLWQFDQLENESYKFHLPDPDAIQSLLQQKPGMMDIIVNQSNLSDHQIHSNNPSVALDFGAFAKGVAIEKMMHKLKTRNIDNALINAGGDLKVLGSKNGTPWRIGIKNPGHSQDPTTQPVIAAINLYSEESLFTSGDYERFFEFEGRHYHHIIDPRTGYPATGTRSVTVLTKDAGLADAASTALFIAGPEQWQEIANKMGIKHVMLIAADNRIYLSQAMAERVELLTQATTVIIK